MADVTGSEILRRIDYRPDLAFSVHRHLSHRYPFLLESAASGTPQGRYDILFAAPEEVLTLDADGRLAGPGAERRHDFLNALNGWWQQEHVELPPSDRPFRGGWFLFLAYELAAQIEPTLRLESRGGELPIALAARVRSGLVADHATRTAWVFAESECADRLTSMTNDVEHVERRRELLSPDGTLLLGELFEESPETYLRSIAQAKQYIRDGDIFQANLSREWQGSLRPGVDASDVYARLRAANPGPFAGIMRWGGHAVISSSPERLLMVRDHVAQTRPIAGTRPRGEDAEADERLSAELIAHPKERAEHVMLIDLERNDLGRVCMPGTVSVNELMVIETYAHVHHIVSNVRGRLRSDVLPGDALRAVFPGGTITGCPKVRCMEIIDELEPEPRRSYTGSIGYLNRDGSLDSNILIRTLELVGDRLTFRAGGGIVADSVPEREVQETRAKARGLKLALIGDSS